MRTDCALDGRQVLCRNASTIGYSSVFLRVGMPFTFRDGEETRTARMLARVKYAPQLAHNEKPIKNWILAMVLSPMGTHCYERWVNPDDVTQTHPEAPTKLAAFFFAPKLPYDVHTMRRLMAHGTIADSYIDNAPERVADWQAREQA